VSAAGVKDGAAKAEDPIDGIRGPGSPRLPQLQFATLYETQPPPAPPASPGDGALGPYIRAVRAHRLVFVLVVLAALLGSGAWLTLKARDYEATARLLVTPLPQDDHDFLGFELLRDSGDPTRTVQTAATLVESRPAAARTAAILGRGWTADKVRNDLQVKPEGESNIVAVTATAQNAALSARLANTFVTNSLSQRKDSLKKQIDAEITRLTPQAVRDKAAAQRISQLQALSQRGDPTLAVSEQAVAPTSAAGPSPALIVVLAFVAGLALGVGACILLELTGHRIRDEEEATALYPVPVLARVPELSRRKRRSPSGGQGWYMPPPIREAFRSLVVELRREPGHNVLMVMSASTGDGKTTSAVNLAVSLAAAGHPAVLMDFDMRKPDVAKVLNLKETRSLVDMIDPKATLDSLVREVPGLPQLRVLATGAAREGDYALVEVLGRRFPQFLAEARRMAEYVVIDTAPLGAVSDALRLTDEVDDVVLVTHAGRTDRGNFDLMRELLERSGKRPLGMIVLGEVPAASGRYYAYGMAQRRAMAVPTGLGSRRSAGD
jgi:tyrosine-protein kinase